MANTYANKILVLLIVSCFTTSFLMAQHTSVQVNVYSGWYSFRGNGASAASSNLDIPYKIYGRQPGFSYAFEVQVKRITRHKHLFGLEVGREQVKTNTQIIFYQTDIELPYYDPGIPPPSKTVLTNSFFVVNPFIGHQFSFGAIKLDALAGVDWAFCTRSHIDIKAVSLGFANEKLQGSVDLRPRVQLNVGYKHLSLLSGYSLGLKRFDAGINTQVSSNFLRLGVGYTIN